MACPRRLVSATVTSWSAASDFWITTRARAVTDEAEALTIEQQPQAQLSGLGCVRLFGEGTQLGHAAGQQAGDLHLGDAEAAGDLGLGQALEEPQLDHLALAARQLVEQGVEGGALFGPSQLGVLLAQPLAEGLSRISVGPRRVQRGEPVGLAGLERLEHVFLGGLDLGGQFGDVR